MFHSLPSPKEISGRRAGAAVAIGTPPHGPLGVQPRPLIVRCRNAESSTAIAQYDLVVLDVTQSSTDTGQGSAALGSPSNSKFANVKVSPAAKAAGTSGLYGIAQEAIVAGATGNILFSGISLCKAQSGTYTQGELVGLRDSSGAAATISRASVTQIIGMVISTSAASATQATVLLDGSVSFGTAS